MVLPPACSAGTVAITIRRPSERVWELSELAGGGLFARCAVAGREAADLDGLLGATVVYSIAVDKDSNVYAATPYGVFKLESR